MASVVFLLALGCMPAVFLSSEAQSPTGFKANTAFLRSGNKISGSTELIVQQHTTAVQNLHQQFARCEMAGCALHGVFIFLCMHLFACALETRDIRYLLSVEIVTCREARVGSSELGSPWRLGGRAQEWRAWRREGPQRGAVPQQPSSPGKEASAFTCMF